MSEQFTELRVHLEHEAVQPAFDQLRARRRQRTQRYAIGGVMAALVVALLGVGIAIQTLRPSAAPAPGSSLTVGPTPTSPAPSATGTPSSSTSSASSVPGAPDPTLAVQAAAQSGSTLLALTTACADSVCVHDPSTGTYAWQLRSSHDGAKTWQHRNLRLSVVPAGAVGLFVTADGYTWIVVPQQREIIAVPPGDAPEQDYIVAMQAAEPSLAVAGSVAGNVLWVGWGTQLYRVSADPTVNAQQVFTAAGPVVAVAASSATTALVGAQTTQSGPAKWSLTSNSGQSFETVGDPCAGTPFPGTFFVTVAFGGSTAWATCAGGPAAGQEPKTMAVSTDLRHWSVRGNVESSGYATNVVAFSGTAAWRYGDRAEIYRTTDGQHWSSVGKPTDGPKVFVALDIDHAVYLGNENTDQLYWYATADGGKTWTKTPDTW